MRPIGTQIVLGMAILTLSGWAARADDGFKGPGWYEVVTYNDSGASVIFSGPYRDQAACVVGIKNTPDSPAPDNPDYRVECTLLQQDLS